MIDLEGLPPGHVIRVMMEEHLTILDNLKKLRKLNNHIQDMGALPEEHRVLHSLKVVASNLIRVDSHRRREEDVLFPHLQNVGFSGPPAVMQMEHEDLRQLKMELADLVEQAQVMGFGVFQTKLNRLVVSLADAFEDHIHKENTILFPRALADLNEDHWPDMRKACDEIGYCDFVSI